MAKKRRKMRCDSCGRLDDSTVPCGRVARVITNEGGTANLCERCRCRQGRSRASREA